MKLGQRALIRLDLCTKLWMELCTKQFVTILRSTAAQSFLGIKKDRDISGGNGLNQDVMVQVCGVSMQRWLGGAAGLAAAGSAGMAVAGPQLALPLGIYITPGIATQSLAAALPTHGELTDMLHTVLDANAEGATCGSSSTPATSPAC